MRTHWERAHARRPAERLSWFEPVPHTSLALIERAAPHRGAAIVDVGGGVSTLVDHLLDRGYARVTVADISRRALDVARRRLGVRAGRVRWLCADVLEGLAGGPWDVWHDRAVFHFLVGPADRHRYFEAVAKATRPGAHLIVATFHATGPPRCSGLPVQRYDAATLAREWAPLARVVEVRHTVHVTPAGVRQPFVYAWMRRTAPRHPVDYGT